MKENKALIILNNGNIRSNESGIGLYSRFINEAKRNTVKNITRTLFDNLSEENKAEWLKAMNGWNKAKEKDNKKYEKAVSPSKFYDMKADRIQFTRLHEIVLDTLEEMYNQQSVDNVYNWMKGKNGDNYNNMGRVYTNPAQIAKYIWGVANPKYVKQVADVLFDLSNENVYLSRVERHDNKEIYIVKEVKLIITRSTSCITTKTGQIKEYYSYIQLHPVFFEKIRKFYIPRRNNLISKLRQFYFDKRKDSKKKQVYMLPPDEPRYLAQYLYDFAVNKKYNLVLDEETIAKEINIKEFEHKNLSRGRAKITTALDALVSAEMLKGWKSGKGKKGQHQYNIEINPIYFGAEDKTTTKTTENKQ